MGSKEDAIDDNPDRFARYLDDDAMNYIAQGATQADRIHRLKEKFEKLFPEEDKGERFVFGGKGANDYDLTGSPEYARALEKIYDCTYFQNELKKKAVTVMRERITAIEETKRAEKMYKKMLTVKDLPKKFQITVGGYRNKKGKWVGGYVRDAPEPWTKPQEDWVTKHYRKWDISEFSVRFNNKWKTKRLKGGIVAKYYRLVKK